MSDTSSSVGFLYGTAVGRGILKTVMKLHLDRVAVRFLWSRCSKPMVKRYVKKNNIPITEEECRSFRSYREMFVRTRAQVPVDMTPQHLVSPCDSLLSAFDIDEDSCFSLKKSTG